MNIKVIYDRQTAQPWVVRVVRNGERYGLENKLTHTGSEPLVEFYDARYPFTVLGQFVSRYNAGTMLDHSKSKGLNLDGGVPEWSISGFVMAQVINWLHLELATEIAQGLFLREDLLEAA